MRVLRSPCGCFQVKVTRSSERRAVIPLEPLQVMLAGCRMVQEAAGTVLVLLASPPELPGHPALLAGRQGATAAKLLAWVSLES